jgi:NitT/TauT family transport system substrate-binding protein
MKKYIIILIVCLAAVLFVSAGAKDIPKDNSDSVTVRVSALKGPTAMGMVKLMQDSDEGKTANQYSFSLTSID